MEETKYTYCRVCEPNCGIKATVVDGRITKITGDREHPLSQGFICPRGLATLDIHNDPDRLRNPVKRVDGRFQPVAWGEAIADIGLRLKNIKEKYGPDSVAAYIGNPVAFDSGFSLYMPLAVLTLGTRNIYSSGSQDCNNKFAAAQRVFGSPLLHPVPDIEKIDFLIIFGSNPAVSQMSFISLARPVERLRKIVERNGRVIIIDPRRTETAREVGEHIFIRPDTDVCLMLAMLHVIIRDGLYDKEVVNNNTRGITELGELAADYPPAKAAKVTGIPKDVIEKLARDFATAENAGIHGSLGINLGTFGTLAYWLIQCLNAVTGRLDRRGSMIFCEAPVDVPALYKRLSKNYAHKLSRIGNFPTVMDSLPAGILADEILTPGEGRIKALIVVSGNPMLTVPDPEKLEKAFKSLDLLVCLDLYVNETGGLADYVLACADFYERWDFTWTSMLFNPVRFINYSDAVVRPDGDQRDSWTIMHDVLKASGYTLGKNRTYSFVTNYLDRAGKILRIAEPLGFRPKLIVRALAAASGVSWSKLTRSGHGVLLKDHETGKFFTKRILTDDKRVNLAPPEFIGEAPALKEFFNDEKKYDGFKLIGQRRRRTHNSWFGNVAHLVEKERANLLSMNPGDASELGIRDGDMVEVESDFGSIGIAARVDDDLMPGVVSIPHGWGHDKASGLNVAQKYPGTNVNRLMAASAGKLEKFAGMTMLTGVRVKLKKIKKKKREVADE